MDRKKKRVKKIIHSKKEKGGFQEWQQLKKIQKN